MRITAVELMTRDRAGQEHFYGQVLGLPVLAVDDRLEVSAGASRLVFRQAPPGWEGAYHFAFNIPPSLFPEAKSWAAARANLYPGPNGSGEVTHTSWHADAVYFADPAGNVLELIARRELPDMGPATFDGRSIVSVSEIGLAVPDVGHAVAALDGEAGLQPYGNPSNDFAAVGDAHGLLILVRPGRAWFPDTGVPARPIFTAVLLDNAAGATFQVTVDDGPLVILPVD